MNLSRMMIDRMFIERHDGTRNGPFKTRFGSDTLLVFQDELKIEEGDLIIQPLRDGSERAHRVEGYSFNAPRGKVPAHYSIRIVNSSEPIAPREHGTVPSAVNPAVNAAVTQGIADAMNSLERAIESSSFSVQEKNNAISLLKTLRENEIVAFVLKRNE